VGASGEDGGEAVAGLGLGERVIERDGELVPGWLPDRLCARAPGDSDRREEPSLLEAGLRDEEKERDLDDEGERERVRDEREREPERL